MNLAILFLFLFAIFETCTPGTILYLVPVPSKSHFLLGERLVEALAERGHEIIVVAPFRRLRPVDNVQEIYVPHVTESLPADETLSSNVDGAAFHPRRNLPSLHSKGMMVVIEKTMTHQPVIDLLNSQRKIDLVVGITAGAEAIFAGFAHKFKSPTVSISTSVPSTNLNELVGNPAPSSYVPDRSLGYTDRMNFCQRLVNFLHATLSQVSFHVFYLPRQDSLMRKHFGNDLPPLKELLANNSLLLVNHHFGLGSPRPYLPNTIEIGGFHVRPAKSLPKDVQMYMDEAEDGVIYFNLGSAVRLREGTIRDVLRSFSNLTQKVLWKFDAVDTMENPPENVKISKWLPQSDILAHPNLKLFITHGGLLTLTESIYRGVPILGIPTGPDQRANLIQLENLKLGLKLDAITDEGMSRAIQKILTDATYSKNAKWRRDILQDRPLPPIDAAVYWMEYAMRHNGAPHLRPAGARHLAWYQLHLLDVCLLLSVVFFAAVFSTLKFSSWILGFLRECRLSGKFPPKKTN